MTPLYSIHLLCPRKQLPFYLEKKTNGKLPVLGQCLLCLSSAWESRRPSPGYCTTSIVDASLFPDKANYILEPLICSTRLLCNVGKPCYRSPKWAISCSNTNHCTFGEVCIMVHPRPNRSWSLCNAENVLIIFTSSILIEADRSSSFKVCMKRPRSDIFEKSKMLYFRAFVTLE